jgi:anti-anti-sigma factor
MQKREQLIEFSEHGRITVGTVRATSMLSALNVAEFGSEVVEYVNAHPKICLLLNFEHVNYLSSAVLSELLRIQKSVHEVEGRLRLCAVADNIREIFEITNLDRMFVIHKDEVEVDVRRFERSLEIAAQEAAWDPPQDKA